MEWDPTDYRIFVGDLGNEVTDDILYKAFSHYGSIKKAKMVKNKITGKNKGARCCIVELRSPQSGARELHGDTTCARRLDTQGTQSTNLYDRVHGRTWYQTGITRPLNNVAWTAPASLGH